MTLRGGGGRIVKQGLYMSQHSDKGVKSWKKSSLGHLFSSKVVGRSKGGGEGY